SAGQRCAGAAAHPAGASVVRPVRAVTLAPVRSCDGWHGCDVRGEDGAATVGSCRRGAGIHTSREDDMQVFARNLGYGLALAIAAIAAPSHARQGGTAMDLQPPVERPVLGNFVGEPGIPPEMMTAGFLAGHPDVRWRREGQHSYSRGEYDIALDQFLRAARYGDKPAQAMLAEMYWKGIGVARDRPRGYAWMDIAAERRFPNFVILRERYWNNLDARERERAIDVGRPLMDEYGDARARLRLAKVMRRNQHVA